MCTALFSIYESSEKIWFEPWYATSHHISPEENKYFHWLYKLNNFDCLEQLFKLKFQKEIVFYNTKLLRQSLTICVWIFFFFTVSVPACLWVYSNVSAVWYNSSVRGQVPRRSLQTRSQRPQDQDVRIRKRIPGTSTGFEVYSHLSVIACI